MNFILEGIIPSKKNSRRIITRGGRIYSVPSVNHEAWVTTQTWKILQKSVKYKDKWTLPIKSPVRINVNFSSRTKRKWDLSNKFESIADLLVNCRVLKDDNYSILQEVNLRFFPERKEDIAYVSIELLGSDNE